MNKPGESLFTTRPTVTIELPLDKHTQILNPEQVILKSADGYHDIGALCYASRSDNQRKSGQPREVITNSIIKQRPKQILQIIKALSSLSSDGGLALSTIGLYAENFISFMDWTDTNGLHDCLAGGEATRHAFRASANNWDERYKRQEIGEARDASPKLCLQTAGGSDRPPRPHAGNPQVQTKVQPQQRNRSTRVSRFRSTPSH